MLGNPLSCSSVHQFLSDGVKRIFFMWLYLFDRYGLLIAETIRPRGRTPTRAGCAPNPVAVMTGDDQDFML
jgi:hypothetical protein